MYQILSKINWNKKRTSINLHFVEFIVTRSKCLPSHGQSFFFRAGAKFVIRQREIQFTCNLFKMLNIYEPQLTIQIFIIS